VTTWELVERGTGTGRLAAALLAAMLVKPAGLQMAAVLGVVAVLLAAARVVDRGRAARVLAAAIGAGVAAFAVFYAWQPSRFLATGPSTDTFAEYAAKRWSMLPTLWHEYWGRLGWLDYDAPAFWYWLMLALVAVNVACLLWRPERPTRLAWYLAALWIVFVGSTFAAEMRYLREAGYTFQGRYLLPAGLGFGVILLHQVRAARVALFAGLIALQLVLMDVTVHRYYGNGWRGMVNALPFRG
jgi:hypothetical protein